MPESKQGTLADYVEFRDEKLAQKFGSTPIPMSTLYEAYFDGALELKTDLTTLLKKRHLFVKYSLTQDHLKWAVTNFVPEVSIHSKARDQRIVREHYDRGNDFFQSFLGDRMAYTCAFFSQSGESLDSAQWSKLDRVCAKLGLEPGMKLLDVGSGWGALLAHAAEHYGVDATGVSLAEKETEHANAHLKRLGLSSRARAVCADYRDIQDQRFDRIACLEMVEHVGVKNLSAFFERLYELLEDDGTLLMQWTGLRRGLHPEDLIWGLFMNKYIFPGADASLPPASMLKATEKAGFECQVLENLSPHYVLTIRAWAENWEANRAAVVERFGERWFRIWSFFLAWSGLVAEQGSAACFQLVLNKNIDQFDRMQRLQLAESRAEILNRRDRERERARLFAAE
ncbi:MAG: cyclopropane-fatty-acyl-phospholipid synthase family protein [Polyangiaceae bacterium]